MSMVGLRAHAAFDVEALRADFPTITPDQIYLDSVASSLTPIPVVEAMSEYYLKFRANIHRGTYDLSMRASERFDEAVRAVAGFLGAAPEEIVFTQNTTHSINLVAHTLDFEPGDEIILSNLEHTSNMAPWVHLAKEKGLELRWYAADRDGSFDVEEFARLFSPRTKLVTLTYISNVLGTVVPVEEVGRLCREHGVLFLVDAAQAVPHIPIDVRRLDCDFLAFSGHKMLGPTGIGVLYIKLKHAVEMTPGMLGGGTIDTANCECPSLEECSIDYCSFTDLPHKWQAGTPPIAEALGLQAAIGYLQEVGLDRLAAYEHGLMQRLLQGLTEIRGVDLYGPADADQRIGIVSFNVGTIPPEEIGRILNERHGIAVRAGQHCAVNYFNFDDVQGVGHAAGNVRAGLYLYNTTAEIERFLEAVDEVASVLVR
ncbi:cysteine desulfurase [Actinomadura barringtoniae]|uniref:cysteine desulfurase n=1 Tax=Actinomadura barringtoniae TaxID=1427535 RepID=A0A939PNL2_9ACTN|nr:cysteine desulfurase [Actinomadura barringtoniae]MBO2453378.1 cysteine desulfurase [Actinomadura barringtoniae]